MRLFEINRFGFQYSFSLPTSRKNVNYYSRKIFAINFRNMWSEIYIKFIKPVAPHLFTYKNYRKNIWTQLSGDNTIKKKHCISQAMFKMSQNMGQVFYNKCHFLTLVIVFIVFSSGNRHQAFFFSSTNMEFLLWKLLFICFPNNFSP